MPTSQGQFTPLPEALCDVIMDLTSQGQSATIENIRVKLSIRYETKLWIIHTTKRNIQFSEYLQIPAYASANKWYDLRQFSATNAREQNLSNSQGLLHCHTRVSEQHFMDGMKGQKSKWDFLCNLQTSSKSLSTTQSSWLWWSIRR